MDLTFQEWLEAAEETTLTELGVPLSGMPMRDLPERFRRGEAVFDLLHVEVAVKSKVISGVYRDQAGRGLRVYAR